MDTISKNNNIVLPLDNFANRMFVSVVSIFLLLAVMFLVFQYQRETAYKVDILHNRLQVINHEVGAAYPDTVATLPEGGRLTIIAADGQVLYDNIRDVSEMKNHSSRLEVQKALAEGSGYDIQRTSESLGGEMYFYSATFFPDKGVVVRSALPYNSQLYKDLTIDKTFLFFILGITAVLCFILYQIARRLAETEQQRIEGEKQELKRQLTQNAAHELKTPTASISAYLETMLSDASLTEEKKHHFLERSYAQCQRMTNILSDMSTLARIDSVQQVHEALRIDAAELLECIREDVSFALTKAGIQLTVNVENITILGDRSLVTSIFRNLIDNTIAYAGEGKHITVSGTLLADQTAEFFVTDNGVGVAPQHLNHLCERFYRIDKGRSRKLGGTGLGLAIVKNAVLLHNGEINLMTTPGGGLTVRFTLPAA